MMRLLTRVGCAAFLLAMLATTSRADVVTLTFEGLGDNEQVLNYYDGGYGGNGSGPGPNYGITFGSDSLALISSADGGSGNFSNNPSGDTILYFLSGPGDVMDVPAGFTTGFSFYYAAYYSGSVSVYSGLDGGGSLLANLTLPVTPNPYTVWVPFGVTFAGTAESVVFSGSANYIGFDNITLGSSTPGVPEPSTFILAGLGGIAVIGYDRRRRSRARAAIAS